MSIKEGDMVSCVGGKDKVIISPILAWTDKDVWEFLNKMGIEHCDLYDKGGEEDRMYIMSDV